MLELKRLNAGYGRAQVLFDLSLELERGEVAVLAGRNGAGKSTTVKSIMGLLRPVSGEIRFEGEHIEKLEPFEISRLGLGYVPEDRRIFTDLSVAENLEVGRRPPRAGVPVWTEERLFALFPNLAGARQRLGAHLSGGEQKMLAIARTLMGNPAAILLDEPSEGIAPVIVRQMADTILELKRAGMSVLLCEQNLKFARRVADRAYLIEKGQVREETIKP
ncbi:MAG TPA: ABC transporter ATP-binding protein [Burkholderiales bacterium]|nr:ABC transporter ATP-binding protein [Burkholderiales bacterium]